MSKSPKKQRSDRPTNAAKSNPITPRLTRKERDALREKLARDVNAYLETGGTIQRLQGFYER